MVQVFRHRWAIFGIGSLFLLLVLFAVYSPIWRGEFFFDDNSYLIENPQMFMPDALKRIWLSVELPDYWPLSYSFFLAELKIFGTDATVGYHTANILLHFFNCLLFWQLLRFYRVEWPFVAVLLFALHPLATESVAWIFQTRTTLAGFFVALFLLSYAHFDARSHKRNMGIMFYMLRITQQIFRSPYAGSRLASKLAL